MAKEGPLVARWRELRSEDEQEAARFYSQNREKIWAEVEKANRVERDAAREARAEAENKAFMDRAREKGSARGYVVSTNDRPAEPEEDGEV